MRRISLAGSTALILATWSPAVGAAPVVDRVRAEVAYDGGDTGTGWASDAATWLWDLVEDRLTVPLGPADRNIWPFTTGHNWTRVVDRNHSHRVRSRRATERVDAHHAVEDWSVDATPPVRTTRTQEL
jgi:hypothetical protein